jgi:AraC-like DNA-binding protein
MENAMTLTTVEHALGMIRVYLIECAAQDRWCDDRVGELAQVIAACLQKEPIEVGAQAPAGDIRLARDVVRRAVRFVNDNLDSKLKWADIAIAVRMDPFTFGRTFKQATGVTPHQYVIRCRLRRAMRLLERDELTLADVALEVGCSCQSHLTTLFRKHLGTTPGAFRVSAHDGKRAKSQVHAAFIGSERRDTAPRSERSAFAPALA